MSQRCEALGAPSQTPASPARPWPSAGLSRGALMVLVRQGWFVKKLISRVHLGKRAFFFLNSLGCPAASGVTPRRELCTCSAWPGSAQQSRAPRSPVEPSRAKPSVLSPLIHSLSPGAVVASRELQQGNFPHPLPPSVCLPWQKSSTLVTNTCPHPSSSKALFIFLALIPWCILLASLSLVILGWGGANLVGYSLCSNDRIHDVLATDFSVAGL